MPSKYEPYRTAIMEMVKKGMSDEEIGQALKIKSGYYARDSLGIKAGRPPGGWQVTRSEPEEPEPVIEPELVYEENGVTVRRYPARYAETSSWGKVVR